MNFAMLHRFFFLFALSYWRRAIGAELLALRGAISAAAGGVRGTLKTLKNLCLEGRAREKSLTETTEKIHSDRHELVLLVG